MGEAMKIKSRVLRISAAVAAVMCGISGSVKATDLTWDIDPGTPLAQDGSGAWNTSNLNWYDGASNVAWSNATCGIFAILSIRLTNTQYGSYVQPV